MTPTSEALSNGPPVGIFGRGQFVPDDVLENDDVASVVDPAVLVRFVEENAWCREHGPAVVARTGQPLAGSVDEAREVYAEFILRRVGIARRRVVDRAAILEGRLSMRDVHASDLGALAAERALEDAETDARDVDVVVCATSSPGRLYPATAIEVQERVGAARAHGFDVLAGCSGLVVGLEIAGSLLASSRVRTALLVTAEYFTAGVNYRDPATAYFFGDGAAAFVLKRAADGGRAPIFELEDVRCLSSYSDAITSGLGGTRGAHLAARRMTHRGGCEAADRRDGAAYFEQDGPRAYRDLLPMAAAVTRSVLEPHGLSARDIRRFLPHQASAPLLAGFRRRVLPADAAEDRVATNLLERGNTSSSGAAMLLAEECVAVRGERLLVAVFGAGYTAGAALLRRAG